MSNHHDLPPNAFDYAMLIVMFCLAIVGLAYCTVAPDDKPIMVLDWSEDRGTLRYALPKPFVTTGEAKMLAALDNRYYFAVRDSTRALIRRKYKGDTTTARARAYFAHMDTAYDPTYILP